MTLGADPGGARIRTQRLRQRRLAPRTRRDTAPLKRRSGTGPASIRPSGPRAGARRCSCAGRGANFGGGGAWTGARCAGLCVARAHTQGRPCKSDWSRSPVTPPRTGHLVPPLFAELQTRALMAEALLRLKLCPLPKGLPQPAQAGWVKLRWGMHQVRAGASECGVRAIFALSDECCRASQINVGGDRAQALLLGQGFECEKFSDRSQAPDWHTQPPIFDIL